MESLRTKTQFQTAVGGERDQHRLAAPYQQRGFEVAAPERLARLNVSGKFVGRKRRGVGDEVFQRFAHATLHGLDHARLDDLADFDVASGDHDFTQLGEVFGHEDLARLQITLGACALC